MAIKSILTASVLSVIGAAVSTTAFADNMVNASTFCKPGFYAGLQGGRSDTFYHPDSALAQAISNGAGNSVTTTTTFSPSGAVTTSTVNSSVYNSVSGAKTDDIGMGGRIYAGYQFNPYFAVETGYTQYAKTESNATVKATTFTGTPAVASRTTNSTSYNGEITEHAIDLVAKGTMPLPMGFGVYAKAGLAYIQADNHINATGSSSTTVTPTQIITTTGPVSRSTIYTNTFQKVAPVAGIGVNYTIPNTNMSVTADYTRVFSYGGIPNAKLASLGIEYKFA